MFKLIVKRIFEAIPTMLFLITISFFMMRLAPGSPFTGERNLPPAVLANIEAKYNLNDPLWLQYINYLKQLLQGDFGPSFKYKDYTINELLAQQLPISVEIGTYAFVIATSESRIKLYHQAEQLLQKDNPAIFLYVPVSNRLVKSNIEAASLSDPLVNWQVKDWVIKP